MSENIYEILKKLEDDIKNNNVKPETIKKAINEIKNRKMKLEKLCEWAWKNATGDEKKEIYKLYKKLTMQNLGDMTKEIRSYGFKLRKNNKKVYGRFYDEEKKSPKGISFRLLELVRLGKRDEVFHIILREFSTAGEEIGSILANAFNPVYSDDIFKTFIYSFLTGLLGKTQQKGGEEK